MPRLKRAAISDVIFTISTSTNIRINKTQFMTTIKLCHVPSPGDVFRELF
jgi:hypothetical protein